MSLSMASRADFSFSVDILELRRQGERNSKPVTIAAVVKDTPKSALKRPADKVTKADTSAELDQSIASEGVTFTVGQADEQQLQAGKAIESEHVGIVDVVENESPIASGSGSGVGGEKPPTDDAGPSLASRIIGFLPGGLTHAPSDAPGPETPMDVGSTEEHVADEKAVSSNQVFNSPGDLDPPSAAFSTSHGQGSSSSLTTPTKTTFGLPRTLSSPSLAPPNSTRDPTKVFSSEEYNAGPDVISGRHY